ncbi:MAG: TolC family protein [Paludibacteraceae bacterium]|nr:TolC family protein [Paludibacteraceae bacterium]MBR1996717.1 TolC family protein [Paludibacteraceae bacterium]
MRKIVVLVCLFAFATNMMADDHVMAATKRAPKQEVPATLNLSLEEAQDYAVNQNRSLKNADLAVQKAYAQRWQTIASMLPSVDMSWAFQSMMGYEMEMRTGKNPITGEEMVTKIAMPDNGTLGITASIGINGQAIVGALLNNIAIDMQRLNLEQSEDNLRANVKSSYASVLVLEDVVKLLDSSLKNIEELAVMTQRSVEVGAAEQTQADQILVRVNTLKNNINANKRSTQLAINALKVLLNVPVETELTLTTPLGDLLSPEAVLALLGREFNIANNLSYQTLAKNVELAKTNVHMAGWAYGPTVGVGYQYSKKDYFGGKAGFNMTPPNALSVQVSMPLWSSGKRAAGVVEKKIALEEARNTFAETTDNLGIQNEQLRYNLQNAYETFTNEQENMSVTQRVFDNTSLKFQQGVASNLELVNASNDLITAQSTYVQAVLTLVNAEVELEKFLNL